MPKETQDSDSDDGPRPFDRATDLVMRGLIRATLALPYRTRLSAFGALTQHLVGPLAGYTTRSRQNLEMIYPDWPEEQRNRVAGEVARNMGRVLIENYGPKDLAARAATFPLEGDGLVDLIEAAKSGQRILAVSAHYGNYEAARAALHHHGISFGGVYRPMRNTYFNAHYVDTIRAVAGPVFPSTPAGMTGFVRQMLKGVPMMLLNDLNVWGGEKLSFLGKPARTALTAAEMALRYEAHLFPIYGIRQSKNLLDYRVLIEPPVPPTTAKAMTLALNHSLEQLIAVDPAQWFWIHRRWKS
ncbi:MAG: lauroyl acyltransferase [Pseudomonadota bacterium]